MLAIDKEYMSGVKVCITEWCRCGEVAEWLKAPLSKSGKAAMSSWVQIPPSPHRLGLNLTVSANEPSGYAVVYCSVA